MSSPASKSESFLDASRWIEATYRVRAPASAIEARARAIALEQSVELPLEAVSDSRVLNEVVARVVDIVPADATTFDATIRLSAETTGFEAGQLLNMLFGNTSLQDDVDLIDVKFPAAFAARFRRTSLRHRRHTRNHRRSRATVDVLGAEAARTRARAARHACTNVRARRARCDQG